MRIVASLLLLIIFGSSVSAQAPSCLPFFDDGDLDDCKGGWMYYSKNICSWPPSNPCGTPGEQCITLPGQPAGSHSHVPDPDPVHETHLEHLREYLFPHHDPDDPTVTQYLLSIDDPNDLTFDDDGTAVFTNELDLPNASVRDNIFVDPYSGALTFSLPLPVKIKCRDEEIQLEIKFRSGTDKPKGVLGPFWEPSWTSTLTANAVTCMDCVEHQIEPRVRLRDYMNSLATISEFNGETGHTIWTNSQYVLGKKAFSGSHFVPGRGLPMGNSCVNVIPPNAAQVDQDGNPVYEYQTVEANVQGGVRQHAGFGPSYTLGNINKAKTVNRFLKFAPPLGDFREMRHCCIGTEIREPDGTSHLYTSIFPRVAWETGPCSGGDGSTLSMRQLARRYATIKPNGDVIRYEWKRLAFTSTPRTVSKLVAIYDPFGRKAASFSYYEDGRLYKITDLDGHETVFAYQGNTLETVDFPSPGEAPRQWKFAYDLHWEGPSGVDPRRAVHNRGIFYMNGFEAWPPSVSSAQTPGHSLMRAELYDLGADSNGIWPVYKRHVVKKLYVGSSATFSPVLDGNVQQYGLSGNEKIIEYAYDYEEATCFSELVTTATENKSTASGLKTKYYFDWLGRKIREDQVAVEFDVEAGPTRTTEYRYGDHLKPLGLAGYYDDNLATHDPRDEDTEYVKGGPWLVGPYPLPITVTGPMGGRQGSIYQFMQDDVSLKTYFGRARNAGANLLESRDYPVDYVEGEFNRILKERFWYEPLFNQVYKHEDRENQVTRHFFDYQEVANDLWFDQIFARWGADVPVDFQLDAPDLNDDGVTHQFRGRVIKTVHPAVTVGLAAMVEDQEAEEWYSYNDQGQLLWSRDPNERFTTYEYYPTNDPDGDGSPVVVPDWWDSSCDPPDTGFAKAMTVDDVAPVAPPVTDPLALRTEYEYDNYGHVCMEKDPEGYRTFRSFNARHLIEWEKTGHLDVDYSPLSDDWMLQTYVYGPDDQVVKREQSNNDPLTSHLGASPENVRTLYAYDVLGDLRVVNEEVISPTGVDEHSWFYHYDPNSNPTVMTTPAGRTTAYLYNGWGEVIQKRKCFDPLANPWSSTPPSYHDKDEILEFGYTLNGDQDRVHVYSGPSITNGHTTQITFDEYVRAKSIIYPDGASIEYVLDNRGNPVKVTKHGRRDGQDTVSDSLLAEAIYRYDDRARIYEVETKAFEWVNDGGWQKLDLWNGPALSQVKLDPAGNTVLAVDALGREAVSVFDGAGRLKESISPPVLSASLGALTPNRVEYVHDGLGNVVFEKVTEYTDENGSEQQDVSYIYREFDSQGSMTLEIFDPVEIDPALVDPENPGNDALVSRFEYNSLGRKTGQWNPNGVGTRFEYDTAGRLLATQTGFSTGFDEAGPGTIVGVDNPDGYIRIETDYDADGNALRQRDDLENQTETDYDQIGRIQEKRNADGSYDVLRYRPNGMLESESKFDPSDNELFSVSYFYDDLLRKTQANIDRSQCLL